MDGGDSLPIRRGEQLVSSRVGDGGAHGGGSGKAKVVDKASRGKVTRRESYKEPRMYVPVVIQLQQLCVAVDKASRGKKERQLPPVVGI
jgi:hypothetical protein